MTGQQRDVGDYPEVLSPWTESRVQECRRITLFCLLTGLLWVSHVRATAHAPVGQSVPLFYGRCFSLSVLASLLEAVCMCRHLCKHSHNSMNVGNDGLTRMPYFFYPFTRLSCPLIRLVLVS